MTRHDQFMYARLLLLPAPARAESVCLCSLVQFGGFGLEFVLAFGFWQVTCVDVNWCMV